MLLGIVWSRIFTLASKIMLSVISSCKSEEQIIFKVSHIVTELMNYYNFVKAH